MSRCCITAASSLRLSRVQGAKVHEIIPIISVAIIADGVGVSWILATLTGYTNTSRVVQVDLHSMTDSRSRCVCTGIETTDSPFVHDEQTKSFVPGFNSWLPSKLPTGRLDLRWSSTELTAASPGVTLLRRWLRLNYTVLAFSLGSLEQAGLQQ